MCTSVWCGCPAPTSWRRGRKPPPSSARTTSGSRPTLRADSIHAKIDRIASLGWLARLTLRLPDDTIIVAHVPQDQLAGAGEGDTISVDLRNPKAFHRDDAISAQTLAETDDAAQEVPSSA